MIVPQSVIDEIRSSRIRRRTLTVPTRQGKHGERKRCPMKPGGVYNLKPRIPYDRHRAQAEQQPTRARAVLHLITACEAKGRTVMITVRHVELVENTWQVSFEKGDLGADLDAPVFLARHGDYTTSVSQKVPGEPEVLMPLEKDLARARARALERQVAPQLAQTRQVLAGVETLRQAMAAMKLRNARAAECVRQAERKLQEATRILLSEGLVSSVGERCPSGSAGEADGPPRGVAVASLDGEAA